MVGAADEDLTKGIVRYVMSVTTHISVLLTQNSTFTLVAEQEYFASIPAYSWLTRDLCVEVKRPKKLYDVTGNERRNEKT